MRRLWLSTRSCMPSLYYDLHIHSCLSPCGDDDSTPGNIVGMAMIKGLDVIAVTDHNSCKNCPAVLKYAREYGITVLPGMELTTAEEVHVLCLFAHLSDALAFDAYVYDRLPTIQNREDIFGHQYLCDEDDQITGSIPYLLINATTISFDDVWELTANYNGIMIPAHIDKSSFSLIANLGFIPEDSRFTCAEVKDLSRLHELARLNPYLKSCRIINNSDAHQLELIHEPYHTLEVKSRDPEEILRVLSTPQ